MNISDIAKLAGVSVSTVSRYLNNGYVSQKNKDKIAQVIRETGYAPLTAAQNLKTQNLHTIGVIIPRLNSESVGRVVDGITKRFKDINYEILLASTHNDTQKEIDYLDYFSKNQVDGLIFLATEINDSHRAILKNFNKPFVIATQSINEFPSVYNDDEGAAYTATKHLIDQGCKDIVYLGVLEEDKAAGQSRHKGYTKALEEHGLKSVEEKLVDFSIYEGYSGINDIIGSGKNFDGIFCATDTIAAGALNSLIVSNYKVPEDVKIIGVGDSTISKAMIPSISTIHLYYDELGYEAADMIVNFIEGKTKSNKKIQLGFDLCARQTTES